MSRNALSFLVLLSVIIFPSRSVLAQIPVIKFGIDRGMSDNSVKCIFKDSRGFMWFGAMNGLNRYDGYDFKVFRANPADTNSLIFSVINTIGEDSSGRLWVGTRQGLSIYDGLTEKFTQLRITAANREPMVLTDVINDVLTDNKSNVFVATQNRGLLLCRKGEFSALQVSLGLPSGKKVVDYCLVALTTTGGGCLWGFVQNVGLCVLDTASMTLKLVYPDSQRVSTMESDKDEIWIGSDNGVFNYNLQKRSWSRKFAIDEGGRYSNRVQSLMLDKNDELWIGTYNSGVCIWNKATNSIRRITQDDTEYGLSSGLVNVIYEDEHARKWVGTLKGGVNFIDPKRGKFKLISHDPGMSKGLRGNVISAFIEGSNKVLWIGTEDAGLTKWHRNANNFENVDQFKIEGKILPVGMVRSLAAGRNDQIWVANSPYGVALMDGSGNLLKQYHCVNESTGLENPIVFSLCRSRDNRLWASTLRQGNHFGALYFFNEQTDRFHLFDAGLSDLFSLHEDRGGVLWGGNLNQLVQIDTKNRRHRFYEIGSTVHCMHEDRADNFWIGTEGGGLYLFNRKTGKVTRNFTIRDGLPSDGVLEILEDKAGNLWVSTLNGLSKFDPARKRFYNYYSNDGLQSNQFNYNAALVLKSGEMVFGGLKGFNIFRPEEIEASGDFSPLVITDITVNGSSLKKSGKFLTKISQDHVLELTVPYDQAVISFDYAALEYSVPEKISYTYFLEGWDRNWNPVGQIRAANYTRLSEGDYTFKVKSTNPDGEWNARNVSVRLIVLPPWYRSWWAYLIYTTLIGGVLCLFWMYRIRQTRLKYDISMARMNMEMEKAIREKEKVKYDTDRLISEKEKDLTEKRLNFFTNITHEFRTPLTLIINPLKDILRKIDSTVGNSELVELNVVYRNAKRMRSLIDQLLLFRKEESKMDCLMISRLNFVELAQEVFLCFQQQAKSKGIAYHFECENHFIEIYADRDKMEIVLYNLLSNAIKYTPASGAINFQIKEEDQYVKIAVADTGPGIPVGSEDKIFEKFYMASGPGITPMHGFGIGLYLVKQFVTQHGGNISFENNIPKGAIFHLSILKGKQHLGNVPQDIGLKQEIVAQDENFKSEPFFETGRITTESNRLEDLISARKTILIVDDEDEMRQYLSGIFEAQFVVYQVNNGAMGLDIVRKYAPDIVISDIKMEGVDGITFCQAIKGTPALSHIPVILLTATTSEESKLEGVESGADDYITKPFEKELLVARVRTLLNNRSNLQRYFYNEVTLSENNLKISEEYKLFLENCIEIVERNLENDKFTVKDLAREIGMSHSAVFKKIKEVSGQSINGFIRFIRLRKAAELFIKTSYNIRQVGDAVGITDRTHFREHFTRQFGMPPAEYIRKFRRPFNSDYGINKDRFES